MTQTSTTKTDITTIVTNGGASPIEIARVARTIPEIEILAQDYRNAWAAYYRAQRELSTVNEALCDDMNRAFFLVRSVREYDVDAMTTLVNAYAASAPAGRAAIRGQLVELKAHMISLVDPDNRGIIESMFASAITTGTAIMVTERCVATIRDIKAELVALAD